MVNVARMKRHLLFLLFVLPGLLLTGGCCLWVWHAKRQYTLNGKLITALLHNDATQALALVNSGADPNTHSDPSPVPSLAELLRHLLYRSPSPVDTSLTVFMLACGMRSNWTGVDVAALRQQPDALSLVQTMLSHGAQVNIQTRENETALIRAVFLNRTRVVSLLLEHGAEVNVTGSYGNTVLMAAVRNQNDAVVHLLLTHGARVNTQDDWGYTALVYAMDDRSRSAVITQLMAYGADPNLANEHGQTALKFARKLHRSDILALLQHGK